MAMKRIVQYAGLIVLSLLLTILAVKFIQPNSKPQIRQQESTYFIAPAEESETVQQRPSQRPSWGFSQQPLSAEILQEREAVYLAFAEISEQLSSGQAVNEREVEALMQRQQALVQKGAVTLDEAVSYSLFLKQALPDMARSMDMYILSLEQQDQS